jgi:hypothetical protein
MAVLGLERAHCFSERLVIQVFVGWGYAELDIQSAKSATQVDASNCPIANFKYVMVIIWMTKVLLVTL